MVKRFGGGVPPLLEGQRAEGWEALGWQGTGLSGETEQQKVRADSTESGAVRPAAVGGGNGCALGSSSHQQTRGPIIQPSADPRACHPAISRPEGLWGPAPGSLRGREGRGGRPPGPCSQEGVVWGEEVQGGSWPSPGRRR